MILDWLAHIVASLGHMLAVALPSCPTWGSGISDLVFSLLSFSRRFLWLFPWGDELICLFMIVSFEIFFFTYKVVDKGIGLLRGSGSSAK